jgi:IclR family transcriptional regulator, acetate operon repressor
MARAVERALRLLMAIAEPANEESSGLRHLAAAADVDKATALRLLRTLQATRMVEQRADGSYALGSSTLRLARAAFARTGVVGRAIPIMHELAEATTETISLGERHGDANVTIYEVESRHAVRYANTIGASAPLHLGAGGRATLAFSEPELQERILASALERRTDNSITAADTLRATLAETRARGYATSWGERTPSTYSVAAPILDASGKATASISILWPSRGKAIDRERLATWPALLLAATHRLNGDR